MKLILIIEDASKRESNAGDDCNGDVVNLCVR